MENRYLGMPDIPVLANGEDWLDMGRYVDGLVKFVSECYTPMSIALQGDGGTGKTSFINRMRGALEKSQDSKIVTVYFNTWQYSQFNMSDSLYYSFVHCIVNCINRKKQINQLTKDKLMKSLRSVAIDIGKQFLESKTGLSLDSIGEELSKFGIEKMEHIEKLRDDYGKLINETSGEEGRVVIFIDDLDRLNPDTAVALLETIKLFMDVKNCVFVLAIDYDVVVRGIRAKYGADMDDVKCRSFFDKIIQLPFRMPIEKYQIKNMLENGSLKRQFEGYTDILGSLIENTLGPNPRTFKRIINSYELLRIVEQKGDDPYEATLLLISLIFQMHAYDSYVLFLESACDDVKSFQEFRNDKDKTEYINPIFEALDSVIDKSKKGEQVIFDFQDKMNTSAITSVVTIQSNRNTPTKVTSIYVLGSKEEVHNATEATTLTVEKILKKYPNSINDIINKLSGSITIDESRNTSKFRNKREIKVDGYPATIYLGLSSGFGDKVKLVKNILGIVGIEENEVEWYNDESKLMNTGK